MTGKADTSDHHFSWLVEGRFRNQRSTVALYATIERHSLLLAENLLFQTIAQELASIAFSLWRAVFLSDLSGGTEHRLADLNRFLGSLLAHNAVLYQTDYNSREWAFVYYLDNALMRLDRLMAVSRILILPVGTIETAATAKEDWSNAQSALDLAITNFTKALADNDGS